MRTEAQAEVLALDVVASDGRDEIRSGIDTVLSPSAGTSAGAGSGGDVTLTAPRYARPGGTTQLSLRFRGLAGPGSASMSLPEGVAVVSAFPPATTAGQGTLAWEGLTSASGSIKVRVTVPATALPGTALAFGGTLTDARGSVGDTMSVLVREGVEAASPAVQVTAPSFVVSGAWTTATLRATNVGDGALLDLALPAGVRFVSSIPAPTQVEEGRVRWTLGQATSVKMNVRLELDAGIEAGRPLHLVAKLVDAAGSGSASATMTTR
jgi:hypothetical protein